MSADVRAKWEQMEQFPAIATFFPHCCPTFVSQFSRIYRYIFKYLHIYIYICKYIDIVDGFFPR